MLENSNNFGSGNRVVMMLVMTHVSRFYLHLVVASVRLLNELQDQTLTFKA